MLISSRGRYALRILLDLAEQNPQSYTPMKGIAERQNISLKYMEKIMKILSENHLIEGVQGKGGGFRLLRKPEEYDLAEILTLTEGTLAPVSCLDLEEGNCLRSAECPTLPVWKQLETIITEYLGSVTLVDLLRQERDFLEK